MTTPCLRPALLLPVPQITCRHSGCVALYFGTDKPAAREQRPSYGSPQDGCAEVTPAQVPLRKVGSAGGRRCGPQVPLGTRHGHPLGAEHLPSPARGTTRRASRNRRVATHHSCRTGRSGAHSAALDPELFHTPHLPLPATLLQMFKLLFTNSPAAPRKACCNHRTLFFFFFDIRTVTHTHATAPILRVQKSETFNCYKLTVC